MIQVNNDLPYQKLWYSLEDYKNEFKSFGKPFLEVVPKKWAKEFKTVAEMYETIMLDLQFNVNMYFNQFFDHVNLEQIPINLQELIKYALFHSFASKLYGVLFANKNIKTSFSTSTGYSITQDLTRTTGSYLDIFTPEAMKALNLANIRQTMNANDNDWEKTLTELGQLNFDSIYTKQEIDELLEILRIDTETMIETIANWVEERLQIFTDELPENEEVMDKVATEIVNKESFIDGVVDKLGDKVATKDEILWEKVPNTNDARLKSGSIDAGKKYLKNVANGVSDTDAVNKSQLDTKANKSDLPDLDSYEKVKDHLSDIDRLEGIVDTKANLTDLNDYETTTNHNNDITDVKNKINVKQDLIDWTKIKSPFTIISDIDSNVRFHIDYANVQIYNKEGKSIIYVGEDVRFVRSDNNAVTLQYTADGKLLYGATSQLSEVATKDDIIVGKEGWIIGETKPMAIGSIMPEGWVKLDFEKDFTLINGDTAGTSNGWIKSHKHSIQDMSPTGGEFDGQTFGGTSILTNTGKYRNFNPETDEDGQQYNKAAGLYREFWEYQPSIYIKLKNGEKVEGYLL